MDKETKEIPSARYHTDLTRSGIKAGVVAFLEANNMAEGSASSSPEVPVDLFNLLEKYLLDLEARSRINKIIHSLRE